VAHGWVEAPVEPLQLGDGQEVRVLLDALIGGKGAAPVEEAAAGGGV
jgi:hypothetical protein